MKRLIKKAVSSVLVLLVVLGSISFAGQNKAFSATTLNCPNYTVNGITVNEDSVEHKGPDGCVRYARAMYKILWGVEYNNKFVGDSETGYNMLCELSGEERKITPVTAWKYISQAAVGAVIRTEDTDTNADGNEGTGGHSLIIVEITRDGFTALEHWNSRGGVTQKYTWEQFANSDGNESFHAYFKYIKWPGAGVYKETVESGKCGENVTYTFDKSTGTLTISGIGDMWDFVDEGMIWDFQPWYGYGEDIKKVVINEGVTQIGKNSFRYCRNIEEVAIPSSVNNIGELAFGYIDNLTTVKIPEGVETIGDYAFYGCGLESIVIPKSVTEIKECAFNSNSITDIYYTGTEDEWSKITISDYAFLYNTNNITIHYNYTEKEPTFFEKIISFFDQIISFFLGLFKI